MDINKHLERSSSKYISKQNTVTLQQQERVTMSNSTNTVLVFGAAGGVGRAAAMSASKRGAKVWLAMRNTSKPIPGQSEADEKEAGFERVQADLKDLSSLKTAVEKSGATIAFVYCIPDSEDYMRSAFDTLKESGITDVVLLSSFLVSPTPEASKDLHFITKFHAETEMQLRGSGLSYVAVRPAFFNSNMFWYLDGIKKGEVELFGLEARQDFIAPEDIGTVAGMLLATPSARLAENGEKGKAIFLCGPKIMEVREALGIVAEALGKEVKAKSLDEEEALKRMAHFPREFAESIVASTKGNIPPRSDYTEDRWRPAVENLRKYLGREPTSFGDWVQAHKEEFV
jgi:uncharacterized protein YbjT (DUF2867 family)